MFIAADKTRMLASLKYVAVAALVAFAGCGPSKRGEEQPSEEVFGRIKAKGTYVHRASGVEFAPQVGSFKRTKVQYYDRDQRNISAEYHFNLLGVRIAVASVYIYPADIEPGQGEADIERQFDQMRRTLLEIYPDSNNVSVESISLTRGWGTAGGKQLSFEYKAPALFRKKDYIGKAYLFAHRGWFLKYRLTYPKEHRRLAEKEFGRFMELLEWPTLSAPDSGN